MKEQNRKLFYQIVAHLLDIDEKAEIINETEYYIEIKSRAKYNPRLRSFSISKIDEGRIIIHTYSNEKLYVNGDIFEGDFTIKSIAELNVLLNIILHTR